MVFGPPNRSRGKASSRAQAFGVPLSVLFLSLVALLHLEYTWCLGAFFPTGLSRFVLPLVLFLLEAFALVNSLWLTLNRNTRRNGATGAAVTLAVIAILIFLTEPIQTFAIRRDIGTQAQSWAVDLLQRPLSEILDPTDPDDPRVKEELVPAFLKRGYFRSARCVKPGRDENETYIVVSYGGRPEVNGYCLGRTTLVISQGGHDRTRKIMLGVYSFRSPEF